MSDDDIARAVSCAQKRELKKGEVLLKDTEVCRSFYLVDHGYLRTWCNKDGLAINVNFTFEGEYTTNYKSAKTRTLSDLVIEAAEDTAVWIFNLDVINKEFEAHPALVLFIRRVATSLLLRSEEHSNLFKLYSPAGRYDYIEKNHPHMLQRVPLTQLATYLGVTRETLSRIRGRRTGAE